MTENDHKKKILIIDDDEQTRETYAEIFRQDGYEVLEAKDGVEGLDVATSHEGIDAIFTGIIMPRMDGFQMMEALKEQAATANIPVFINSHLGREEDRKEAEKLGAKDFIIRGVISPAEVVKRIDRQFYGGKYMLKIDPYEMDGQKFIEEIKLPEEFVCRNCGTLLALEVASDKGALKTTVVCPNCGEKY